MEGLALKYLTAAILGLVFTILVTLQHTNSMYRRWRMAFFTSLCIAGCVWFQLKALVKGDDGVFLTFQICAAFGSSLGILLGHKVQDLLGGKK